jgi:hypothetical protein
LLELLLASGNRSQRSQFYDETARILAERNELDAAFTINVWRTGMPAMPAMPATELVDGSFETGLERAVGLRAAGLRVRARTMTENELVVLCRSHLEHVARGGGAQWANRHTPRPLLGCRDRATGG